MGFGLPASTAFGVQDEEKEKPKKHKMDEDELRMQLKAILDSNKANMLQISSEMKSLHTSVTGFDARIQTMEHAIDTKFVGIDGRMEKLDSLLTGFDNGVKASVTEVLNDVVAPRMSAVEENCAKFSESIKSLEDKFQKLQQAQSSASSVASAASTNASTAAEKAVTALKMAKEFPNNFMCQINHKMMAGATEISLHVLSKSMDGFNGTHHRWKKVS